MRQIDHELFARAVELRCDLPFTDENIQERGLVLALLDSRKRLQEDEGREKILEFRRQAKALGMSPHDLWLMLEHETMEEWRIMVEDNECP